MRRSIIKCIYQFLFLQLKEGPDKRLNGSFLVIKLFLMGHLEFEL